MIFFKIAKSLGKVITNFYRLTATHHV